MLRLLPLGLLASFALPLTVQAQAVPACNGTEPQRAAQGIEHGDAAMGRAASLSARNRTTQAQAAYEDALAAYDEACAAGAELALERRALPLARLGRALPAIESLDVFLSAHPVDSLPEADRARIESNLRALERDVATLSVGSIPVGATVFMDEREIGTTPIQRARFLPAEDVVLTLRAEGHESQTLHITLTRGETQRLNVQLTRLPTEPEPPVVQAHDDERVDAHLDDHVDARVAPASEVSPAAPAPLVHEPSADLVPWIALSFGTAAATLGLGIGGTLWADDRRNVNNGVCFGIGAEFVPDCSSIRGQHDTALGLAITGYALAAAATVTGTVLLIVMATGDHNTSASLRCAPGLLGASCAGTF